MGAVRDRIEHGVARRRLGPLSDDSARLGLFDGRRRSGASAAAHLCEGAGGGGEQSGRGPARTENGGFVVAAIATAGSPSRRTRSLTRRRGYGGLCGAVACCGASGAGAYTLTGAGRSRIQ